MRSSLSKIVVAGCLCCVGVRAFAVNLVQNGDFETGNFSNWTVNDPSGNGIVVFGSAWGISPFGSWQAYMGTYINGSNPSGFDGSISQTLTTVANQAYQLTFWMANSGQNGLVPNHFKAEIDGNTVIDFTNLPAQAYTKYTYNFVASSASALLKFSALHDPTAYYVDNVEVHALNPVPEPFTMGLGLAAAGVFVRRRMVRKSA